MRGRSSSDLEVGNEQLVAVSEIVERSAAVPESIDKPIPEYLRHIRGRVDQPAEDVTDVMHGMASLETGLALAKREVTVAADRAHAVLEALSGFDDEFVALLEEGRRDQTPMQYREPLRSTCSTPTSSPTSARTSRRRLPGAFPQEHGLTVPWAQWALAIGLPVSAGKLRRLLLAPNDPSVEGQPDLPEEEAAICVAVPFTAEPTGCEPA